MIALERGRANWKKNLLFEIVHSEGTEKDQDPAGIQKSERFADDVHGDQAAAEVHGEHEQGHDEPAEGEILA